MKLNKKFFDELKKQIRKDFGKKCKSYSPLCACCSVWLAYETLRDLYGVDYVEVKLSKKGKIIKKTKN